MPTPIERFSASGTAFMIASRRPTSTRTVMTTPSITITPIAPLASRPLAVRVKATMALMPEAGGQGERIVADDPHGDRHDPGDECRAGRHSRGIEPQRLGDDAAVHEHDVGHDHERGHAGPRLGDQVGPAFGELEVGCQAVTRHARPSC